jgi:transcriptional regulator with XRE-family HTH domain
MSVDDGSPQPDSLTPEQQVGAALRLAREAGGLSLRQMAKRVGHNSHSTISAYENGVTMPSDAVVEGYERVLGLSGELIELLGSARVERHGDAFAKRRPQLPLMSVPEATGSDDPVVANSRPWRLRMSRRWSVILICGVVLVVAAGTVTALKMSDSSTPAMHVVDGADPEDSGCARVPGVVYLDTTEVDYAGLPAGVVQLVYSPACGAAWPRFEASSRANLPTLAPIHVDIVRPDDQNVRSVFEAPFTGPAVYGNMLLSTSKCVYAVAWIADGTKQIPESRTHCWRGKTYVR